MNEILGSVWWLIVSLGILVTFHEFGHYWVARRCGVRVLRFSVGFGRPLLSRTGKDGTEYVVAAIPLGGYVKMLDEREGDVAPDDAHLAFNRKPVWQRMAIVIAGPVANLVLCVALLWGMFVVGRPDFVPAIGRADGVAAAAGLQVGDVITAIDGHATPTWTEAEFYLLPAALDRHDVAVSVRTPTGANATRTLRLSRLPPTTNLDQIALDIGLTPRHWLVPARIAKVTAGSASDGVLQPGDLVTAIDGRPVRSWIDIQPFVQAVGKRGGDAMVEVDRGGERRAYPLKPMWFDPGDEGGARFTLGVSPAKPPLPSPDAVLRYGPVQAFTTAVGETGKQSREIVAMIGRAVTGRLDVKQAVAGPITIARAANASASQGVSRFLALLAMLSLSLAILNLLPVPILDGGHLLYYLIELAKGRPLSERAMAAGQFVGLALIVGLMGLAFYNDIVNNLVR